MAQPGGESMATMSGAASLMASSRAGIDTPSAPTSTAILEVVGDRSSSMTARSRPLRTPTSIPSDRNLGSSAMGQELQEVRAGQHPQGPSPAADHHRRRGLEMVEGHLHRVLVLHQGEGR